MPAVIEDDFVSYVDLALDLWVSADGRQTVLDEDELEELNLDDALKQKVCDSLKELQEVVTKRLNSGESKNPPN
jgi:protein associated with RNAse G/E